MGKKIIDIKMQHNASRGRKEKAGGGDQSLMKKLSMKYVDGSWCFAVVSPAKAGCSPPQRGVKKPRPHRQSENAGVVVVDRTREIGGPRMSVGGGDCFLTTYDGSGNNKLTGNA